MSSKGVHQVSEGRRISSANGAAADVPARGRNGARRQTAVVLEPAPAWLSAIEGVLERLEIDVVGTATSQERALVLLAGTQPDLLVAEPGEAGLAFVRAASSRVPELRTIVFSGSGALDDIDAAFAAGACAYVLKTHPRDFASAVRQLFDRSIHFAHDREVPPPQQRRPKGLTQKETEILRAVADGRTNAEIARTLWVTTSTVKFHLGRIYRKLGVRNRTAAARTAGALGLLEGSASGDRSQP